MSKKQRSGAGGGKTGEYITAHNVFWGEYKVPIYDKIPPGFTIDAPDNMHSTSNIPEEYVHILRWHKSGRIAEGYVKKEIIQRVLDEQEQTLRGVPQEYKKIIQRVQSAGATGVFPRGIRMKVENTDDARYANIVLRTIDKNYPVLEGFKYKIWEAKNDEPAMYAVKRDGRITRADAKPLLYPISYPNDGTKNMLELGDVDSARMGFIKSRMYIQAGLMTD